MKRQWFTQTGWTGRRILAVALCGLVVAANMTARGAEGPAEEGRTPLAVLSLAGVDRLLEDVEFLLQSIDRAPLTGALRGSLAGLNDLKGIDRSRPCGVLLYLQDLQEDPQPVCFFPVSNIDDLQQTLRLSKHISLEPTDDPERYTVHTPNDRFPVRIVDGYAFIALQGDLPDEKLPTAAELAAELHPEYDAALTIRREGISQAAFDTALTDLRKERETELVRQENEGEAEYRIRRAVTESLLHLVEQMVTDGRAITFGWTLPPDKPARLDVDFQVGEGTPLARFLSGLAADDGRFSPQMAEPAPFTWGATWNLSEQGTAILQQVLDLAQREIGKNLDVDLEQETKHPVRRVFDVLHATVQDRRMDAFLQFVGEPPERFVLVGGLRVTNGAALAAALEEILPHAAESPQVREVTMNAAVCGGVSFHRIRGDKLRRQEARLYGEDAALHVGVSENAIWIAVGGERTPLVLEEVLTRVAEETPREEPGRPPLMQAAFHLTNWIGLVGSDDGPRAQQFLDAARKAFPNPNEDALQLQLRPDDSGLRLRLTIDHGYLRLLGLAATQKWSQ